MLEMRLVMILALREFDISFGYKDLDRAYVEARQQRC